MTNLVTLKAREHWLKVSTVISIFFISRWGTKYIFFPQSIKTQIDKPGFPSNDEDSGEFAPFESPLIQETLKCLLPLMLTLEYHTGLIIDNQPGHPHQHLALDFLYVTLEAMHFKQYKL